MSMRAMRRLFTLLILLIALTAGMYTQRVEIVDWYRSVNVPELPEAVGYEEVIEQEAEEETVEEVIEEKMVEDEPIVEIEEKLEASEEGGEEGTDEPERVDEAEPTLPDSINLAVPFTAQAPHGNWGEPYKEACEEASVYMVASYYDGVPEGQMPADETDLDLLQIVAFERELFGFYEDTTAEKTGVFAELMFGYAYTLIYDPTVEKIKEQLVAGRPVIVPAAGRLLGNPYFTAPGPVYHMIVIRGYTQDNQFIVNDPGTKHGEAYLYDFDTIFYAMHDWNNGDEITDGAKVVLVLNP
jgi:hypothetical protein